MKCYNCGLIISNSDDKFCSNCGTKLENNENEINSNENMSYNNFSNNSQLVKDDSTNFLVIGIFLAVCCCLPIGIAVILINELKYKKLLDAGLIKEAKKIKTIMILLICIGFFVFFGLQILNILLTLIEVGVNSSVNI